MDATLEEIVKLAEQLDVDQQNLLIYRLRVQQYADQVSRAHASRSHTAFNEGATREAFVRDIGRLRQIPATPQNKLLGKYANPDVLDMTEEAFHAQLHAISTEWEREPDDLTRDEP